MDAEAVLPRYFVAKPGAGGVMRYFWQPAAALRTAGWRAQRVPLDWHAHGSPSELFRAAVARAELLNEEVDAWRLPRMPKPPEVRPPLDPEAVAVQPAGSTRFFVYVAGTPDGYQKVGVSRSPAQRIRDLSNASGRPLLPYLMILSHGISPRFLERAVHKALHEHRREGEWFACSPAVAVAATLRVVGDHWKGGGQWWKREVNNVQIPVLSGC